MGQAMIPSPSRGTSQEDDHHHDNSTQQVFNEKYFLIFPPDDFLTKNIMNPMISYYHY